MNTQLVNHPNGAVVPVDEPAVADARAAHLVSKTTASALAGPVSGSDYGYSGKSAVGAPSATVAGSDFVYTGPLNLNTQLINHPNGAVVPVDETAVADARAAHLVSKTTASALAGPVSGSDYGYSGKSAVGAPSATDAGSVFVYTGPLNLNTQLINHSIGAVVT